MAAAAGRVYRRLMSKSLLSILAPAAALCGTLALFSGCSSEPDSHLVSAPPPVAPNTPVSTTMTTTTTSAPVVVANPAYVTANPAYVTTTNGVPVTNTIVVTQAPPALQREVVLAQPSPQYVWIAGFWTWRNNQYQWMAGQWVLPPNGSTVWTGPRWAPEGNAYRFYEGYWN
jgi:hypothetical protein